MFVERDPITPLASTTASIRQRADISMLQPSNFSSSPPPVHMSRGTTPNLPYKAGPTSTTAAFLPPAMSTGPPPAQSSSSFNPESAAAVRYRTPSPTGGMGGPLLSTSSSMYSGGRGGPPAAAAASSFLQNDFAPPLSAMTALPSIPKWRSIHANEVREAPRPSMLTPYSLRGGATAVGVGVGVGGAESVAGGMRNNNSNTPMVGDATFPSSTSFTMMGSTSHHHVHMASSTWHSPPLPGNSLPAMANVMWTDEAKRLGGRRAPPPPVDTGLVSPMLDLGTIHADVPPLYYSPPKVWGATVQQQLALEQQQQAMRAQMDRPALQSPPTVRQLLYLQQEGNGAALPDDVIVAGLQTGGSPSHPVSAGTYEPAWLQAQQGGLGHSPHHPVKQLPPRAPSRLEALIQQSLVPPAHFGDDPRPASPTAAVGTSGGAAAAVAHSTTASRRSSQSPHTDRNNESFSSSAAPLQSYHEPPPPPVFVSASHLYNAANITPFRRLEVHQFESYAKSQGPMLGSSDGVVDSRRVWGPRTEAQYEGTYRNWWE